MYNLNKFDEIEDCIRWYPCNLNRIEEETIFRKKTFNLYIHIPYCKSTCNFCPFNKYIFNNKELDKYLNSLSKEIDLIKKQSLLENYHIRSVWIGGGTPSDMTIKQIEKILKKICELKTKDVEFTFEAVSGNSMNKEKIKLLKKYKVNRISLGVETFNDKYLKILNRNHNSKLAKETINILKKEGFQTNIDIMIGLPNQKLEEFKKDLKEIIKQNVEHISFFRFIPIKKTNIYSMIKEKKWVLPNNELYFKMYSIATKELKKAGYKQYTVNHFSKPEKKCVYNIDRWGFPQKETLALGAGAISYNNNFVYANIHDIKEYNKACDNERAPILTGQKMNEAERIRRYVVLGIKMIYFDKEKFLESTGIDFDKLFRKEINKLKSQKLIKNEKKKITLTEIGKAFPNDVSKEFSTEQNKKLEHPKGIHYKNVKK